MNDTITIDRKVIEQARDALNHGIAEMNNRGCAVECMPLHRATRALREALAQQQPVQQQPVVWLPIETAPKDSSMLRLLVNFDDHSLEDGSEPCWTIGTNALSDTGVDEWLFAGWDWTHDRFTQGTGTPIGWLPMLYTSPQAQPLTVEQIWENDAIMALNADAGLSLTMLEKIVRIVEASHSITKGTT